MPAFIKVVPNSDEAVGIVHPVDGALAAEGSFWSYDTFTVRLLTDRTIRRAEATPSAAATPDAATAVAAADSAVAAPAATAGKK